MAQRVGSGIALLFHDPFTRRGYVVSSTPQPPSTSGKDPLPIVQEAGWAPGTVRKGGKYRPHRDSIPVRPSRSQSLYRLSYPAHKRKEYLIYLWRDKCCRYLGLTNLPPQCADRLEIRESQNPGTLSTSPGVYRDGFIFTFALYS